MNLRLFYLPIANAYADVLINYYPWLVCEWHPSIRKWYVLEQHTTGAYAFESMMVGMKRYGYQVRS